MRFSFPDFTKTDCLSFGICGKLTSDKKLQFPTKEMDIAARTGRGDSASVVSLMLAQTKKSNHFHVDVYDRELWKQKSSAKLSPLKDIESELSKFVGTSFDGRVRAFYVVPRKRLPLFISSLIVDAKLNDGSTSIETQGGMLGVKGLPIQQIDWFIVGDDKVGVGFFAKTTIEITNDFLSEAFGAFDSTVSQLFKG